MTSHFDVVVLGAGPGGYVAAVRAAQLGLRTAVIEEKYWGGVCLNVGCIPSKALLRNAELAHIFHAQAGMFGISGEASFDYGVAFDRSRTVADGRVKGVHYLMKKNQITEFDGRGTFRDANTIDVAKADGSTETLTFDHAIIATGSRVRLLPGVELQREHRHLRDADHARASCPGRSRSSARAPSAWSSRTSCATTASRSRSSSSSTGPSPTRTSTSRRRSPSSTASSACRSSRRPRSRPSTDNGSSVTVTYTGADGQPGSLEVDRALISVGFAPNVEGFGLEATGVQLTERGAIAIDERMRTNVPHIYAIGDVTAKLMLAHVAEAQGVVAAETIGGAETMSLGDYRMMPRATFCSPQVASFGLTEQQARDEGYDVKVATFPFTANGKAHGLGEPIGFVKLVADAKYLELLGGHLIGPDVSELLPELTLAQKWDLGALELARNVHTHPTLSEALQEAYHGLVGHMINM